MAHVASRRRPERELALQRHIDATFPRTQTDYLGKEHFWRIADTHEIARRTAGRLFKQICFPIDDIQPGFLLQDGNPVDPSVLEVVVSTRQEQGMLWPPVLIAGTYRGINGRAHDDAYDRGQGLIDAVVRADSVISLATSPNALLRAIFTPKAVGFLAITAETLLELPAE